MCALKCVWNTVLLIYVHVKFDGKACHSNVHPAVHTHKGLKMYEVYKM